MKLQSSIVIPNTHLKFFAFASFLLLSCLLVGNSSSYFQNGLSSSRITNVPRNSIQVIVPSKRPADPPILAYWIYGSTGDGPRILRLLKATYHPRNQYLLLLDSSSTLAERTDLALSVQSHPLFTAFDNVNVVGRTYAVNQMGGSRLAALLHASALLLKITTTTWDWFITLSASDYPLMTQDDILHAFKFLPRDLNFVRFANTSVSDEDEQVKRVVVDPSIYNRKTSPVLYGTETRNAPNMFKILAGSPWVILSRSFVDFCVKGWDNFPRKLLMYMTNLENPLDFYFQTIICNSPGFQNTTIDNDLRFVMSKNDSLGKMEEIAIIAMPLDDAVLQEIDNNILNRSENGVVPGKWCLEDKQNGTTQLGRDINSVEASPRGVKLGVTLSRLASEGIIKRFDGCPKSEEKDLNSINTWLRRCVNFNSHCAINKQTNKQWS